MLAESKVHGDAVWMSPEWAGYWLNAPRELHEGQGLYLGIANHKYPMLFARPSKYSLGLAPDAKRLQRIYRFYLRVAQALHRRLPLLLMRPGLMDNYMDFAWAFRRRDDYIAVMERAIQVLEEREVTPWLDRRGILMSHYAGGENYGDALCVLLGLALNVEVLDFYRS